LAKYVLKIRNRFKKKAQKANPDLLINARIDLKISNIIALDIVNYLLIENKMASILINP